MGIAYILISMDVLATIKHDKKHEIVTRTLILCYSRHKRVIQIKRCSFLRLGVGVHSLHGLGRCSAWPMTESQWCAP